MLCVAVLGGLSEGEARQQLLQDRMPSPVLGPVRPILVPCADSCNFIVWDSADAVHFGKCLEEVLTLWGVPYRVEAVDVVEWDIVGIHVNMGTRLLTNKPDRMWRLRFAVCELLGQGHCAGSLLRIVLGHVIHAFLIQRCALSVLQHSFAFVHAHLDVDTKFSEEVRGELEVVVGLLPFITHFAGAEDYTTAYCSDASLKGYALHYGTFSQAAISRATETFERWRFKAGDPGYGESFVGLLDAVVPLLEARPPPHVPGQLAEASRPGAFEEWVDGQLGKFAKAPPRLEAAVLGANGTRRTAMLQSRGGDEVALDVHQGRLLDLGSLGGLDDGVPPSPHQSPSPPRCGEETVVEPSKATKVKKSSMVHVERDFVSSATL